MSVFTLIGTSGAGKSTLGQLVAKQLHFDFIDTDDILQDIFSMSLQQYLEQNGYMALRQQEQHHLSQHFANQNLSKTIIATGGSVVYSPQLMQMFKNFSKIVYLNINVATFQLRLQQRGFNGLASDANLTLEQVFTERAPLYQKYANVTIDNNSESLDFASQQLQLYIAKNDLKL